jgi:hypothetical protein
MSHFAMLVVAADVDAALAPYSEETPNGDWRGEDGHWDWWVIGGRWRDAALTLKDGRRAVQALACEVDWEATGVLYGVVAEGVWRMRREVYRERPYTEGDDGLRLLSEMSHEEWCERDDALTEEWIAWWNAFVPTLGGDLLVTVVDCHS